MQVVKTNCQEVIVKFRDNHNGQAITFRDGSTSCHSLLIIDDGVRLTVLFLSIVNQELKSIVFPLQVVREYECSFITNYERSKAGGK